jgi:DNA-binding beta-propeller fold protein YncE
MVGIDISEDGLVYVADRGDDRIQVFTKEGKFIKEFLIHPETRGTGSVWSTMFSRDPKQKYLYVADGVNGKIWILNRDDGKEVGSFGHKGHQAGQFDQVERMALDSKGNLYVTEVAPNTRLQKFVPVK